MLDRSIASLSGVDAAYTSGNTHEARSKLEEATFSWNKVSVAISKRGAREPKLLLDSLDSKLKSSAPAAEVNSTIYIMLEELSEDIAAELREEHHPTDPPAQTTEAKARRQLTIAARAIASAGIIASFGLVFFRNKAQSSAELRPTGA